jgi:hypothetical protein
VCVCVCVCICFYHKRIHTAQRRTYGDIGHQINRKGVKSPKWTEFEEVSTEKVSKVQKEQNSSSKGPELPKKEEKRMLTSHNNQPGR